jgi:DNA-binding LacI/PurR family transcriptional regulator
MTVSLALRNSHRISAETRQRIARLATARGYRPDPVINKLMHHLRTRSEGRFRATIACLAPNLDHHYMAEILRGIQERSHALGYNVEKIPPDEIGSPAQLQRILLNRGIGGVILLPIRVPGTLAAAIDWKRFSVVSTTSSIRRPRFHTVIPNHFENMREALRRLADLGCRRIGLAISKATDERVNYRWLAAMTWHNFLHPAQAVPPLIGDHPLPSDALLEWVAREKPDAVIVHPDADEISAIASLPSRRRPKAVALSTPTTAALGGIDQCPDLIGRAATDVLAGLIARNETGVPRSPVTTLVEGKWVSGRQAVRIGQS